MSISRKILVTAAAVAAAVAAGCGGHEEATDTASAPQVPQSASTEQIDLHAAAATTAAPEPITAAESAWREQVARLRHAARRRRQPQRQDHPRLHAPLGQALLRLRAHARARR